MDQDVSRVRVSVVMPVYNAGVFLAASIESILQQTFKSFEFIIINDGSVDGTAEVVKRYKDPRIRYIQFLDNRGLAAALNEGLNHARGEYIVRMDGDDIAVPDRLDKQVTFMDAHPSIGVSGSLAKLVGGTALLNGEIKPDHIGAHLLLDNSLVHPTVIIRRSILEDHDLRYDGFVEDYRLWVKLSKVTEMSLLPEVLLHYRLSDGQFSVRCKPEQIEDANRVRISLFEDLLEKKLSIEERAMVSRGVPKEKITSDYLFNFLDKLKNAKRIYSKSEMDYVLGHLFKRNLYDCRFLWKDIYRVFQPSYLSWREKISIARMIGLQQLTK